MLPLVCAALSDEDNKRRPGRYILLQEQEKRVFGADRVKSSLLKGYEFKALLGNKKWEDVIPKVRCCKAPACRPWCLPQINWSPKRC